MDIVIPLVRTKHNTELEDRDTLGSVIWAVAAALVLLALGLRGIGLWHAAGSTAAPFLTLTAVIVAASVLDLLGVFRFLAQAFVPAGPPSRLTIFGLLIFMALLSALVNLDVAAVVGIPLMLNAAATKHVPLARIAVAGALMANTASFLLPTSNITNLLVLGHRSLGTWAYAQQSWLPWLMVVGLTAAVLSAPRLRSTNAAPTRARNQGNPLVMLLDLLPVFLAASSIRALLPAGLNFGAGFIEQAAAGSVFGAVVNNLPAATAVHAGGPSARWAYILAMDIGPNILITGSVATLICRRAARNRGVPFDAARFSLIGVSILPIQLLAAYAGLKLTGGL